MKYKSLMISRHPKRERPNKCRGRDQTLAVDALPSWQTRVREWGRVGQAGKVRFDWFPSEAAAKDAQFNLQMQKAMRGYE